MHTNYYFAASANQIGRGWFGLQLKKLKLFNGLQHHFKISFLAVKKKSILLISYTKKSLLPQISQLN